jgi:acyl-coenzyme A synthetase/AMP-(fatty) acid ligase
MAPGARRVAAASPPGPEQIGASVKSRLGIRTPKRGEIVPALPKTATGKLDKKLLRERLAAGGDR